MTQDGARQAKDETGLDGVGRGRTRRGHDRAECNRRWVSRTGPSFQKWEVNVIMKLLLNSHLPPVSVHKKLVTKYKKTERFLTPCKMFEESTKSGHL